MELNRNKKAALNETRFRDIRRATENQSAELDATVKRVQSSAEENTEALSRLNTRTDSIELSSTVSASESNAADRSERIAELRSAVEDGSLFNAERLGRAAERLLGHE